MLTCQREYLHCAWYFSFVSYNDAGVRCLQKIHCSVECSDMRTQPETRISQGLHYILDGSAKRRDSSGAPSYFCDICRIYKLTKHPSYATYSANLSPSTCEASAISHIDTDSLGGMISSLLQKNVEHWGHAGADAYKISDHHFRFYCPAKLNVHQITINYSKSQAYKILLHRSII